mgnify:FL=1
MPAALALVWTYVKERSIGQELISKFDEVLGLDLLVSNNAPVDITPQAQALLEARANARDNKNWAESDRLRDELGKLGYTVKDSTTGQTLE